jgi:hypothetical protein
MGDLRKGDSAQRRNFPNEFATEFTPALSPDHTENGAHGRLAYHFARSALSVRRARGEARSLLQLPLQELDLLGQRRVGRHQVFDLAHSVQHGGVVTAAETASDLR